MVRFGSFRETRRRRVGSHPSPPPSSPSLSRFGSVRFGSNHPTLQVRTNSFLSLLSLLSRCGLCPSLVAIAPASLSLSLSLSFFLSLHPSARRTKTKERTNEGRKEGRKVESQGGNACGSIERRAGAWVDHTHDTPAWDPSEKKERRKKEGRKEGRKAHGTESKGRGVIPYRRRRGIQTWACLVCLPNPTKRGKREREREPERTEERMEKVSMADETDVLDEQVRPSCFPSHPRARASTWIQDETKDIRNRRASLVRRTIQDGVEIRTDAKATTGRTRNDDASETSQHVCKPKETKGERAVANRRY